jgi:magnesium transporter
MLLIVNNKNTILLLYKRNHFGIIFTPIVMVIRPTRYLKYIFPMFGTHRTKKILQVNPTLVDDRKEPANVSIQVYEFDGQSLEVHNFTEVRKCETFKQNGKISWINIDGIRKADVEAISEYFDIHPLITEDVLSQGQRPKMDEIQDYLSCVLNMLYYNTEAKTVETEQISIVLGKNVVISFQEDASRDVFNPIREKLKLASSKLRTYGADYLCYAMLDLIVDNYYLVMEHLGEAIEQAEEEVIRRSNTKTLAKINSLRKEMIILKRNVTPARELINGFIRSESDLLADNNTKYYKDVYDHAVQANDLCENYRDMIISLQDLYLNQTNLKMNEVMKVMTIVTCLLAPATVIGGVFGMNFDFLPLRNNHWGFYISVVSMFVIPLIMLIAFRRRGWF